MVARIMIGKSIRGILHYNEQKAAEGSATLIMASGFAGDIEKLDFAHKLRRFEHMTCLKPSVKTNALHISLNFHSSEKLDDAEMQQIAAAYMERIGFGDQPFLVYRHHDVSHQHFHIAT
ncbi:MAG: relaxase/mobilization nuclease domain-containing protein, partial [Pseudosphingobacterium sp.]|nr:relaxase/mobilization nuclease domain-containing protein [Pseudosphingobacterium sp.]